MTLATAGVLVLGLAALTAGGEALVRGASRLALSAGLSPLVVGLTVVAFGTSSPELVVSTLAAARGQPEIALANVVGSNVLNVLFVLGLCAVILPLAISRQVWRREVPILVAASLLLLAFAWDGRIGRAEAALLLAGLVAYVVGAVRASRRESAAAQAEAAHGTALDRPGRWKVAGNAGLVLAGLTGLVLGARWLVDAAVAIARDAGVPETVIGLTIVAIGTSLPEVATSVIATLRGERDIAVGNVVGSNLFNILGIVGVAGLLGPGPLPVAPSLAAFDVPVMTAAAVACLPLFFTGRTLARWEGAVFLGYYAAYVAYLALDATGHELLPAFSSVMWAFVFPLTAITIAVVTWRALQAGRGGARGRAAEG